MSKSGISYDEKRGMIWYRILTVLLPVSCFLSFGNYSYELNALGVPLDQLYDAIPLYAFIMQVEFYGRTALAILLFVCLLMYSRLSTKLCLAAITLTSVSSITLAIAYQETGIAPQLLGAALGTVILYLPTYFYLRNRLIKDYWIDEVEKMQAEGRERFRLKQEAEARQASDAEEPSVQMPPAPSSLKKKFVLSPIVQKDPKKKLEATVQHRSKCSKTKRYVVASSVFLFCLLIAFFLGRASALQSSMQEQVPVEQTRTEKHLAKYGEKDAYISSKDSMVLHKKTLRLCRKNRSKGL